MDKVRRLLRSVPIASKLIVSTSLLVIAVVVVLSVLSIQREEASFRQELSEQATLLLETIPLTIRDALYFVQLDELLDIARVVGNNSDVTLLKIYDTEGRLLVDADEPEPLFSQEPDPLGAQLTGNDPNEVYLQWEEDQLVAGRAVWLGNQPIGAVAVGLSTQSLDEKISALTSQGVFIAFGSLLIAIGLTFLLARQVTRPLNALTGVAARMAGGDYSQRVEQAGTDEVGQLGDSFNQMAEVIEKRDRDLRELNAGLERTVEERTEELRDNLRKLVQTNAELDIARRQAEEATQLKSQFLAAMSHELRTPLNAIMGFSQLLIAGTSGELNEKQADKVDRVLKNARTLLEMINDLLDLAKIEAGHTELFYRSFVVQDWLMNIVKQLEGLAKEKGLTFIHELNDDVPGVLVGDAVRLKQIVMNLLSNAIKFTETGEVAVRISLHAEGIWQIIVSDTGIGIPTHAQEYIFDEFRQVDGSSLRKYGGTGLGLAIVRKLVVMMNGTIRVQSEVGEGSTFTVRLPILIRETEGAPTTVEGKAESEPVQPPDASQVEQENE